MLDRIDSGADRSLNRAGRVNMGGNLQAEGMSGLDGGPHLVVSHQLLARIVSRRRDAT